MLEPLKSKGILSKDFIKHVRRFLPLHRCKPDTMEYILKHESIVSLTFQNEMADNPVESALTELKGNQPLTDTLRRSRIDWTNKNFYLWVKALAEVNLTSAGSSKRAREECRRLEEVMEDALGSNFSNVKAQIMSIIDTVKNHKKKGIGCDVDKLFETNRNVFATLGPTLQ